MYLLLWLAQEYIFQLASFYGILQTLVLVVSLRAEQEAQRGQREEVEEEERLSDHKDEVESEEGHPEDRWAGGDEDEDEDENDEGVSQDEWESEGEEEVGHAWGNLKRNVFDWFYVWYFWRQPLEMQRKQTGLQNMVHKKTKVYTSTKILQYERLESYPEEDSGRQ